MSRLRFFYTGRIMLGMDVTYTDTDLVLPNIWNALFIYEMAHDLGLRAS